LTDIQERLYTVNDLLALGNGGRYELIDGALIEMSPTNAIHGVIAAELLILIGAHVRANKLGRVFAAETGFTLSTASNTVLAPDIAYLSAGRAIPLTEKFVAAAPDLVVEVISPGNTAGEMNEKTGLYFQSGSRQVWIVYPKTRMIHVYTSPTQVTILTSKDTLTGADILPGFSLALDELFRVLDD
jgi:Uma2 family endonuclease